MNVSAASAHGRETGCVRERHIDRRGMVRKDAQWRLTGNGTMVTPERTRRAGRADAPVKLTGRSS